MTESPRYECQGGGSAGLHSEAAGERRRSAGRRRRGLRRRARAALRVSTGLILLAALGACGSRGGCDQPGPYARAEAGVPLRVPSDLSKPEESPAFRIPPSPEDAKSAPCGHYPPKVVPASVATGPTGEAAPAPPVAAAVPPPAAAVAPPSPAPAPVPATAELAQLRSFVADWVESWNSDDLDRYFGFYARDFDPPGDLTLAEWEEGRRGRLDRHPETSVAPESIVVTETGATRTVIEFSQRSELEGVVSTLRKSLVLVREDGAWRIREERVLAVAPRPR